MEEAVDFLATTDEEAAELQAQMERMELKAKAVKDALVKHGEGGLGDRVAAAGCDPTYTAAMDQYFDAVAEFHKAKNRRATASIIIDVWRSLNSARNRGNV
jgi:hypothetical protein